MFDSSCFSLLGTLWTNSGKASYACVEYGSHKAYKMYLMSSGVYHILPNCPERGTEYCKKNAIMNVKHRTN